LRADAACGTARALATIATAHRARTAETFLFRVFVVAWALGALLHLEPVLVFVRDPALAPKVTGALLVVAALAACWRPSVRTSTALAAVQLADVAVQLPAVPNHWLLAGFVNLGWLLARARGGSPQALLAQARAPLMVATAVFYLWTGTWKLNADFLRLDTSCAVASWDRLLRTFAWLPDLPAVRAGIVGGTLAVELLGPVLLLLPATRAIAVLAFVVFHLLLGLDATKVYLNFASVMFPLLLLFLPDAAVVRLGRFVPARAGRLARLAAVGYVAVALAGVAAGPASPLFLLARWAFWLAYATTLVALVLLAVVPPPRRAPMLPAGAAGSLAWAVPVLVALNGAAPILGVKTRTSWQMYSNARLEPDASNHYLFARSLDLAGAMRDRVRVAEGGGEAFHDVAGTGLALPWIEFRRRVAAVPDARVVWERGGRTHATARAADDPDLAAPLPWLVRTFMIFRPLGPGAAARCDW
jgi:hypothetical protein